MIGELTEAPARHAYWTVPQQPLPRRPEFGRRAGVAVLAAGLLTLAAVGAYRIFERAERPAAAAKPPASDTQAAEEHDYVPAARRLSAGAAVLALSVLTDSSIEHYRGAFHNPAMGFAPVASAVSLSHSIHMALTPSHRGPARLVLSGVVLATGVLGVAFHTYNVGKRIGGFRLLNLFYGAPLGAPVAIALSGLATMAASQLALEAREGEPPVLLGRSAGPLLTYGAAVAMLGTVSEAALLHFRGAFHNPFMFVPVTVPPAAAALMVAAIRWSGVRRAARWSLYATAGAGVAGSLFHIYGVSRNMGGFYNWSQNILNGPPIPAPPSFTGVALAGLAAIRLLAAE
jgi:hypothetical protein